MLLRSFILRHGEEILKSVWKGSACSGAALPGADLCDQVLDLLRSMACASAGDGKPVPCEAGAVGGGPAGRLGRDAYAAGLPFDALLSGLNAVRRRLAGRWLGDGVIGPAAAEQLLAFLEAFDAASVAVLGAFFEACDKGKALAFGVVAHELRGPLQSALMANVLLQRLQDARSRQETMDQQKRTLERVARLSDDLVGLAALGMRGALDLRPERIDLCELAAQMVTEVATEFPARTFRFEPCEALPGLWDRLRIGQVLSNLLRNAVHHGDCREAVAVTLIRSGNCAIARIHSQGPPIPPEEHCRIFDPEFSAARGNDVEAHLGLGLFIVREIVQRHRGRVCVRSCEGGGTVFSVILPLADD